MKKIAFVLGLVLIISSFFIVGCSNKYKNLSLELDREEISLELGENNSNNTAEVIATVKGAGKGVSTEVIFTSLTEGVEATVKEKVKNSTTCVISVQDYISVRFAQVKVTTVEGNKSKVISINIIRKIKSVSTNENYKPAIALNSSLLLNSSEALMLEPQNTTQKDFKFSLANQYNGISLTENGELTVGETIPQNGFVEVKATNIDNSTISTTFKVYVVRAITQREEVSVFIDENENLEIALNQKSNVELSFSNSINDDDYYTYYLTELDSFDNPVSTSDAILQISNTAQSYKLNLTASKLGVAKLRVEVGVTGYDKKYASFSFFIEIRVKNIPTLLTVSRLNRLSGLGVNIANASEVNVYDTYADGVLGTDLTFTLSPMGVEEADSYITISAVEELQNLLNYVDVFFADEEVVEDFNLIPNNTTLYFKIKEDVELSESKTFTLTATSNYNKNVEKTITLKLTKGIRDLVVNDEDNNEIENKVIKIRKSNNDNTYSKALIVSAKDIAGNNINVSTSNLQLKLTDGAQDYISIVRDGEISNVWTISTFNTSKTGSTEINFITDNGIIIKFEVIVYEPMDNFKAVFPNTSNIARQTINSETGNVESVYIVLNSSASLRLQYFLNDVQVNSATIIDAYLLSSNYGAVSVFKKLNITGSSLVEEGATLTLVVKYYTADGTEEELSINFKVYCIIPLTKIDINHTNYTLLDSYTVSALEAEEAKLLLEMRLNPVNATFIDGDGKIEWSVSGATTEDNITFTFSGG